MEQIKFDDDIVGLGAENIFEEETDDSLQDYEYELTEEDEAEIERQLEQELEEEELDELDEFEEEFIEEDLDLIDDEFNTSNNEDLYENEKIENSDKDDDNRVEQEEDYELVTDSIHDFIGMDGEIVVMDKTETGDAFELRYVELNQIASVKRIRQGKNVDDLVQTIKSTGLISPVILALTQTENIFVLIDGYRRILACARAGIRKIPAIINKKVTTNTIPVLEAMYNLKKRYTMVELVDYIEYLETEKRIVSGSMIEFLCQLDSGDYNKLKDILEDNDEDIVSKLMDGLFTISQAFKALEKRRSKESREERELKKTAKVFGDAEESGANLVDNSGEIADEDVALTDEEMQELSINIKDLDSEVEDKSLEEMVQEGKEMDGFEPHKQDPNNREYIDPIIKETVLQRDGYKCVCCDFGGPGLKSILDCHHIYGVYASGAKDDPDECTTVCLVCHQMIHDWSFDKLKIVNIGDMTEEYQKRMKKVIKLGNVIRDAMIKKGIKISDLKKNKEDRVQVRRKPGTEQTEG